MYRHTFIRSIGIMLIGLSYAGGIFACTIESGPTLLFSAYLKNVAKEVSDIRAFANNNGSCNGAPGTFSTENRFLSLIDRIDAQMPLARDMSTDFQYSALLTAEGQARNPVMQQGKLIRNLETNTIITGMRNVASRCSLDIRMENGETPEQAMQRILLINRNLESYYKNIALGNTRQPDVQSNEMKALYDEIRDNYSPHATASCKGDGEVGTLEDLMSKIQNRLGQKAKKTENSQNAWNEALDLFAGKGTNTLKYQALQQKLLSAELSRQGLTKKARDAMIGNLTCFQQNTTPTSTIEEMGKARASCMDSVVTGVENLTNWYKPKILEATNTEEYIARVLAHDRAKIRTEDDMAEFWKKLEKAKNVDEKLNEKTITDLVSMHARIVITNELLEKKIPEMQTNCMKAQPGIVGGCQ